MSVTKSELEAFHEFAMRKLSDSSENYSFEDLCVFWRLQNDPQEMQASLNALHEGLEDIRHGRVYDANQVISEIRARLNGEQTA